MFQITAANAKELAARSHESRRLAKLQLENGDLPKPLLADDKHQLLTLSRVRRQLSRAFELLNDELDPNKIDRLAAAIAKLAELDRQLSNRPLPGTLKPSQPKPKRTTDFAAPTPAE